MTPAVSGSGKSPELSAPGNCKALKDGSLGVCCFLQPFSKCLLLCTGAGGVSLWLGPGCLSWCCPRLLFWMLNWILPLLKLSGCFHLHTLFDCCLQSKARMWEEQFCPLCFMWCAKGRKRRWAPGQAMQCVLRPLCCLGSLAAEFHLALVLQQVLWAAAFALEFTGLMSGC